MTQPVAASLQPSCLEDGLQVGHKDLEVVPAPGFRSPGRQVAEALAHKTPP